MKSGTRFIINSAIASMGYGLPAAIGLCVADGRKDTICLEGDGSIMMNLQELQTVVTNNLPIKLFLINNQGYHSIRLTQNNIFQSILKSVSVLNRTTFHSLNFQRLPRLSASLITALIIMTI